MFYQQSFSHNLVNCRRAYQCYCQPSKKGTFFLKRALFLITLKVGGARAPSAPPPFLRHCTRTYSNFSHKLEYMPHVTQLPRRNRQRNIIWFNPPFSKNVKTNIARSFLKLVDTHFPIGNKLHKIFNRNTVKVSYSCMSKVKSIITSHNTRIIRKSQPQDISAENCNCRNKHACPLQNKCMSKDIVYKATIFTGNTQDTKHYIGMSSNTFKERYRNHIKSFTHKKYSNKTEHSKHVWHLKQKKTDFTIKCSIIKKSISYTGGSKICNLCLEEKISILKEKNNFLLNKRSEIVSACQRKSRFQVNNLNKERNAHTRPRFRLEHKRSSPIFEICLPPEDSLWMKQFLSFSVSF